MPRPSPDYYRKLPARIGSLLTAQQVGQRTVTMVFAAVVLSGGTAEAGQLAVLCLTSSM